MMPVKTKATIHEFTIVLANVEELTPDLADALYEVFDDGTAGFGSYNGYPQYFRENVYSYGDMVSITHGGHNLKIGADIKRNIENSEFDVSRPSYEMFDPLFFAADAPAE